MTSRNLTWTLYVRANAVSDSLERGLQKSMEVVSLNGPTCVSIVTWLPYRRPVHTKRCVMDGHEECG
jgi:hypothetical protein